MSTHEPHHRQSSTADRRRRRPRLNMAGFVLRSGEVSRVIDVIDLNYDGCGIRTPVVLEVGESVKISVLGRGSISAQVRWYREGKAGLAFEPFAEETKKQIERRAGRTPIAGEIGLRMAGRANYQTQVLDLSTDGCKVQLVERPSIGDQMLVKFDGLEVIGAMVAWVDDHLGGLRFERSLHPAVLDLLLARLGAD